MTTLGALAATVFGVLTLGKPYWSLESLPILLVLAALLLILWRGSMQHQAVLGVIVIVVAVGTAIAPDLSVALLVYGAVAYLLVRGGEQILAFRRRDWFAGLTVIGLVLFGIMSALWLNVTSIVVGLIIGPALIAVGSIAFIRAPGNRTAERAKNQDAITIPQRLSQLESAQYSYSSSPWRQRLLAESHCPRPQRWICLRNIPSLLARGPADC